jgi:pimeloyl-ACP methyl ester carboxylesterase
MNDRSAALQAQSHSKNRGLSPFHWLFGLFSLALRSSGELTRVIGEIHHTARDTPLPWDREHQADIAKAPKAYLLIKLLFDHSANQLHKALDHMPSTERVSQPLHRLRSAMNGVMGDKLQQWNHPLTLAMEAVDEHGQDIHLPDLATQSEQGVVLFIHGLCLSESDWQGHVHAQFVAELKQQGYGVAWLRYNTGLPIWENGAELSRFLEQHWVHDGSQKCIRLVGHSMGGLLIRSACLHANHQASYRWLESLSHSVYLAAPHNGAPMEKIGNMANSILGVTPYSRPLMALGNIRSRGIRSLRYANVTQPHDATETQAPMPFYEGCQHFLLGARKFYEPTNRWLGDGLVPEESAMGGPHFPEQHDLVERVMLDDVGHISLLQDARLYDHLRRWLKMVESELNQENS